MITVLCCTVLYASVLALWAISFDQGTNWKLYTLFGGVAVVALWMLVQVV